MRRAVIIRYQYKEGLIAKLFLYFFLNKQKKQPRYWSPPQLQFPVPHRVYRSADR